MSTQTTSALAQLEELRRKVPEAEQRVAALERERTIAARALDRAMGPLRDYWEQVGAGDRDPDPDVEARLTAELREARSTLTLRPGSNIGGGLVLEAVDERTEAQLAGARRAVEERQADVERFMRDHRDELVAELAGEAAKVRERYEAARRELLDCEQARKALGREWLPLMRLLGIPSDDLPPSPLATDLDTQPVELPVPRSLAPVGGAET